MKNILGPLPAPRRVAVSLIGAAAAGSALIVTGLLYAAAVFQPDIQPTGWVSPPRLSTPDLAANGGVMFKTSFNKMDWSGNLFAMNVSADGTVNWQNPKWSAAAQLDALDWNDSTIGRKIVTVRSDGTPIPFRWGPNNVGLGNPPGAKPNAQSAVLGDKVTGPKVLNFIRGDRSNELDDVMRIRSSVLGDIVHSQPAYYEYAANGPRRVFVGANDGMLHAFNADTGAELFAYIPSMIIPRLADLAADPYEHSYMVDGSPAVRKVTIGGTPKVYVVGGIGAGGSGTGRSGVDGLYALDVTDSTPPASEDEAAKKIAWELTPTSRIYNGAVIPTTDYASLGQVYGAPLILQVNDNNRWVAIVGNGYNSANGKSSLLVINIGDGTLLKEIVADSSGTANNPGGLSKPAAIDIDGDGISDFVYAGDINGNLYRFDLRGTSGNWGATKIFTDPNNLAITGAPALKFHPLGGIMVNFGTGRLFTASDAVDNTSTYAVYGIRDVNRTTGQPLSSPIAANSLVTQTVTERLYTGCLYGTCRVRVTSNNAVDLTAKSGWKLSLPPGERVVGDGSFVNTQARFAFTSTNPTIDNPDTTSIIPNGENWLMEVQYDSGTAVVTPFLDMNGDGSIDAADLLQVSGSLSTVPMGRLLSYGVASQPTLAQVSSNSKSYVNNNADVGPEAINPDPNNCSGVCNGHFDWDIYAGCDYEYNNGIVTGWGGCNDHSHTHQWDDKYNVTGVNMLNPSNPAAKLSNEIPASSSTPFKILLAGQQLTPAMSIIMDGAANSTNYVQAITLETSNTLDLAALPTWSMAGGGGTTKLSTFIVNLPKFAFSTRLWEQPGAPQCTPAPGTECRVGVIPNQTGCVTSNSNASGTVGEPEMVGAFTIQIVKASTDPSDIELNVAGNPKMGWRLKHNQQAQQNMLAMYTMFWHAHGAGCYGDPGYNPNPPPVADGRPGSPPAGTGDPTVGTTIPGAPANNNQAIVTMVNFITGATTTSTTDFHATGLRYTTVEKSNEKNGPLVTTKVGGGPPGDGARETSTKLVTGRVSWREMIRP